MIIFNEEKKLNEEKEKEEKKENAKFLKKNMK